MKKQAQCIIFAILIAGSTIVTAQTGKGKFILCEQTYVEFSGNDGALGTTNLSYTIFPGNNNGDSDGRMFSGNLAPRVGYFVIDNLAVGIDAFLANLSYTSDTYKYSNLSYTVGSFVRYYIPTERFFLLAEMNYSIGNSNYRRETEWDDLTLRKSAIQMYYAAFGLAVPLGEKVTFDTLAGYHVLMSKNKYDTASKLKPVSGTIGLNIGFSIYLGSD